MKVAKWLSLHGPWGWNWGYICWLVKPSCWWTLFDRTLSGVLGTSIIENLQPSLKRSSSLVTCTHSSALGRLLLLGHWEGTLFSGSARTISSVFRWSSGGNWSTKTGVGTDMPSHYVMETLDLMLCGYIGEVSSSSCGTKQMFKFTEKDILHEQEESNVDMTPLHRLVRMKIIPQLLSLLSILSSTL